MKNMVYEIYELMNEEYSTNCFVVWQTITDSVKYINTKKNVQKWLIENKIEGFDLDNPTQRMDYRDYNKLISILNS